MTNSKFYSENPNVDNSNELKTMLASFLAATEIYNRKLKVSTEEKNLAEQI
jgi:hypothetical protein